MWLHWHYSLGISIVFAIAATHLRRTRQRPGLRSLVTELSIMFGLYTLWRVCGMLSVMGVEHAVSRGHGVWTFERAVHLPNEVRIQAWVLQHHWLVRGANFYYAIFHAPALGAFLLWLYVRRRDIYPVVRTTLGLVTFACLAVQLVPVAPPRMFPQFGFVDTGRLYGPEVYDAALGPNSFNQLSAMPSVHVGWAVLIGWFAWRHSTSRWRWVAVAHAVLTVFVVTVTANHWLLDGIVAVAFIVLGHQLSTAVDRLVATRRFRLQIQSVGMSEVNATTSTIR